GNAAVAEAECDDDTQAGGVGREERGEMATGVAVELERIADRISVGTKRLDRIITEAWTYKRAHSRTLRREQLWSASALGLSFALMLTTGLATWWVTVLCVVAMIASEWQARRDVRAIQETEER